MHQNPSAMEPLLPDRTEELRSLAFRIIQTSARTAGHVHPVVLAELIELLRVVNSYYSNLIEGNSTRPVDIERAMRADYSKDPAKRIRQQEALAHVEVQRVLEAQLLAEPELEVTSDAFLCRIHREFYERMPPELRVVGHPESGERLAVIPGALRTQAVQVGGHIAPDPQSLPRFLDRFHAAYRLAAHPGGEGALIATAAAHHRLSWIHPFLDGNGRVTRLFSDACLRRAGLEGYGLWTVSRGLARALTDYRSQLAAADGPRRGDYDGRGNLSMQALREFCRFFLEVCLDQAEYMSEMLRLDRLAERVRGYVALRGNALALAPAGGAPLAEAAAPLLIAVLVFGQLPRGEAGRASGYAERKASMLIAQLIAEGLLKSDSPKGPVRMGFPAHALPYLFPELV